MSLVPTDALIKKIMQNEILHAEDDFDGVLDLTGMMLFVNSPVLSRTTVKADLTPPTFAGYAEKTAIVLGALHQRADKGWAYDTPLEVFSMSDALLPTTIQGYGLLATGNTVLYAAEYFPEPVSLVTTFDLCQFIAQFCLYGSDWGQVVMAS